MYSFGSNLDGRLGIGSNFTYNYKCPVDSPMKVIFPTHSNIVKIVSGFSHVCAISEDNSVYSWGLGDYGALGTG